MTTKPPKSKPDLESHRLDTPIRDWPYRITSGEVIRALFGHGFFKPQRLWFTKVEKHVVYWEASYRNGRKLTGTLRENAVFGAKRIDICSEVKVDAEFFPKKGRHLKLVRGKTMAVEKTVIEARVLQRIERAKAGGVSPELDAIYELKWVQPEIGAMAVQLAGHANASQGQEIYWIFGLNDRGLPEDPRPPDKRTKPLTGTAVKHMKPENLPQDLATCFDGVVPHIRSHILTTYDGNDILILCVETDQAPYVVRMSAANAAGASATLNENLVVPWREMTATRSARRQDLVRILAPSIALPTMKAERLSLTPHPKGRYAVTVSAYVVPREPVWILKRGSSLAVDLGQGQIEASEVALDRPFAQGEAFFIPNGSRGTKRPRGPKRNIKLSYNADEAEVTGPGIINVIGVLETTREWVPGEAPGMIGVQGSLSIANVDASLAFQCSFKLRGADSDRLVYDPAEESARSSPGGRDWKQS